MMKKRVTEFSDYSSTPRRARRQPLPGFRTQIKEFAEKEGISLTDLAIAMGISPQSLNKLLYTKHKLSPELAIMLERTTGTKAEIWMKQASQEAINDLRQSKYVPKKSPVGEIIKGSRSSKKLKKLLEQKASIAKVSFEFEIPAIVAKATVVTALEVL